ncbi:uncharacterized protein CELE_K08C9.1 [Caenorhabditis elegans]|uniref:Uncharacterized protein n=1 Tax=Caenorhabditis elegans TaxID=6239 RepID=Q9XUT5_CAEEL|nr:Uncharacterized protein CELE_K08C9.1 [Caenorhabditis elegans]CAB04586.1 Uncharacterized protein CELE_K08C9.1 [Caenorhabditis elegans]|eukprot:NP_492934.1 Uncharacterized protein CELE_K08C9.1 [Caenorhabditis elegans]
MTSSFLAVFLMLQLVQFSLAADSATQKPKHSNPMYQVGFELKKPMVVPAAEGDFHNTMILVDNLRTGNRDSYKYAMIGVILLDGVFTFSGIEETYIPNLEKSGSNFCMPFKGINVVKKCNMEYFLLNADFVNLEKTVFKKSQTLDNVCTGPENTFKTPDAGNYVVRYGERVLMTYKAGSNYRKCIGTYDVDDDLFTCVMPTDNNGFEGLEMGGFLYDPVTGEPHRDDGSVEVFCKIPHKF